MISFGVSFIKDSAFTVILTVSDAAGNTHTDTMTVTVNDTTNPVADAGDNQTVDQGDTLTFNGSGSTDNVAVTNFTWTFTDGGAQTVYGSGATYTFDNARIIECRISYRKSYRTSEERSLILSRFVPDLCTGFYLNLLY